MAEVDFFNTNEGRSYPFVPAYDPTDDTIELVARAIVDFGALLGPGSSFEADTHSVYLYRLSRTGNVFTFEFATDAPGLAGQLLTFERDLADELYETQFSAVEEAFTPESDVFGSTNEVVCDDILLWDGYLVVGSLTELAADFASGSELFPDADQLVIMPELLRSLVGQFVNTINLANQDRTRVTAEESCDALVWPYPTDVIIIQAQCLQGDVRFSAGFNATLTQNALDVELELGADVGAGAGSPCEQIPLFAGEAPLTGSQLLEGGPRCRDVVRSVNGIGGPVLPLIGGKGATVTPDPENNKVIVNVDMSELATCYVAELTVSEEL